MTRPNPILAMLMQARPQMAGPGPDIQAQMPTGGPSPLSAALGVGPPPPGSDPVMQDIQTKQDTNKKEEESFSAALLRGMANSQDKPTKGQFATNAIANFARGALMGPNFKSIQQEVEENRQKQHQLETARLSQVITQKRSESYDLQQQANQQRLIKQAEENNAMRAFAETMKNARSEADRDQKDDLADRDKEFKAWIASMTTIPKTASGVRKDEADIGLTNARTDKTQNVSSNMTELAQRLAGMNPEDRQAVLGSLRATSLAGMKPRQVPNGQLPGLDGSLPNDIVMRMDKLSDNIRQDPNIKIFNDVRDAYQRINRSAKRSDGVGDLTLLRSYAKITDPTTGVKEEEYRSMQAARGALERLGVQMSGGWFHGEQLTPEGRKAFLELSKGLYEGHKNTYGTVIDRYRKMADAWGLGGHKELIAGDLLAEDDKQPTPGGKVQEAPRRMPATSAPPTGLAPSGGLDADAIRKKVIEMRGKQ